MHVSVCCGIYVLLHTVLQERECGSGAVLETQKLAEEFNNEHVAFILRIYESSGGRGKVRLTTLYPEIDMKVLYCCVCDLLEEQEEGGKLAWKGGISLNIKPFEVITLKVVLSR